MNIKSFFLVVLISTGSSALSQTNSVVYKEIKGIKLKMDDYLSETYTSSKTYPAMVFFFGGGWINGKPSQFAPHAKYLSAKGIICFLADYCVKERNNTTRFEALMNAKSAIRYLKKHASDYNIDTAKIITAGASAGGPISSRNSLVRQLY
jgi:acetyl esterase/lipase